MAIKLEKALGVSAESWFTMQSAYELWHADQDKALLRGFLSLNLDERAPWDFLDIPRNLDANMY